MTLRQTCQILMNHCHITIWWFNLEFNLERKETSFKVSPEHAQHTYPWPFKYLLRKKKHECLSVTSAVGTRHTKCVSELAKLGSWVWGQSSQTTFFTAISWIFLRDLCILQQGLSEKHPSSYRRVVPKLQVMNPKGVISLSLGVMQGPTVCTFSSLTWLNQSLLINIFFVMALSAVINLLNFKIVYLRY